MQTELTSRIQSILTDSYEFFVRHFTRIVAVCLPFLFAASFFDYILATTYQSTPMAVVAPLLLNLLIYPIYTAALIQLMARRARQEEPTNGQLVVAGLQLWGPLFVLKTAMVIVIGLGFSLLIFPGIYLAIRMAFAEFHLVLFGANPKEAIRRSFEDTREHLALVLILLLVTYVPIFVLSVTLDQIAQWLTGSEFFRIIVSAGSSLIGLFVPVVLFRAFMDVNSAQAAPPAPPAEP